MNALALFLVIAGSFALGYGHGWATQWVWQRLLPGSQTRIPVGFLALLLLVKLGFTAFALIGLIGGFGQAGLGLGTMARVGASLSGFIAGLGAFIYFEFLVDSK